MIAPIHTEQNVRRAAFFVSANLLKSIILPWFADKSFS
ncbi:hypothetical protein SZ54_4609 [Rhizobium sp. UR51a]|nr:hypothetical protein SZ54_4609 [Rhizobium sp. UR51a]